MWGWIALGAVAALVWLAHSWAWPIRPCRWCKGGRKTAPEVGPGQWRRSWRACRWCGGSGRKVRIGARLMGRKL